MTGFLVRIQRQKKTHLARQTRFSFLDCEQDPCVKSDSYFLRVPKTNLLPSISREEPYVFASEADMLNVVVFGHTAKEWRESNPDLAKQGNIRDHASEIELTVLSNMESLNAFLIQRGASMQARFEALYQAAISQFLVLRQGLPGPQE